MTDYKQLITDQINRLHVITREQLVLNVMSLDNPHTFRQVEFDIALDNLLDSGNIVMLYFSCATSNHVSYNRTLYFPKGTTFNFNPNRVKSRSQTKEEWIEKYGTAEDI